MKEGDLKNLDQTASLDDDSFIQVDARHPYLIIFIGNDGGKRYKLKRGQMTVGRSPQADITIDDQRISRIHCIIEWISETIMIEDKESTNGTFVDSQKVSRAHLLPGVTIQLGHSVMKIEYKDDTEIRSEENLLRQVSIDPITGIFNRQHFLKLASMEVSYACRHQLAVGVILLNIDNFKQINDTYGHQTGDFILARLAGIINKMTRNEDLFARYTDTEFILMPRDDLNKQYMFTQCERIRKAIKNFEFRFGKKCVRITISLGFHLEKVKGRDFNAKIFDLIGKAERALYLAKEIGYDRTESLL
ncbi:MAG: diguanylate cyclase [Desulfobacterales bacterium]|nr:MAG: diguanylate cyclase [Desulfobacterales bacterium]